MSQLLNGLAASGGIAIAPVHLLGFGQTANHNQLANDVNHEVARLHDSFRITADELTQLAAQASAKWGERLSLADQQTLVNDWQFQANVSRLLVRDKLTAEAALAQYQRENQPAGEEEQSAHQAAVLADVVDRLLYHLTSNARPQLDHRAIIVTPEITPSLVASFDPRLVAGVITDHGGLTAHSALLSAELGIPAVVGTRQASQLAEEDMVAIVDGVHGKVILQPTPSEIDEYQQAAANYHQHQAELTALKSAPSVTADGTRVAVAANVTLPSELSAVQESGAEGIGLYRSEYLFVAADHEISERDQEHAYRQALAAVPDQRVVVRVVDFGGDKQPAPASGLAPVPHRGLRYLLEHPAVLRPQLRALLKASPAGKLAIMFPFVTTLDEFQRALALVDLERRRLELAGCEVAKDIEVGMMIETPAAVLLADQFAKYADFFSIGTNDLVQYLFASDRNGADLARHYSALNPAVLRAIHQVIVAAHEEGKSVSLCGNLAANRLAQSLLLGMGIDALSVPPANILALRQVVRQLSPRRLQPVVKKALAAESADEVAKLVEERINSLNQI